MFEDIMRLDGWFTETLRDFLITRFPWMLVGALMGGFAAWELGKFRCGVVGMLSSKAPANRKKRRLRKRK